MAVLSDWNSERGGALTWEKEGLRYGGRELWIVFAFDI